MLSDSISLLEGNFTWAKKNKQRRAFLNKRRSQQVEEEGRRHQQTLESQVTNTRRNTRFSDKGELQLYTLLQR